MIYWYIENNWPWEFTGSYLYSTHWVSSFYSAHKSHWKKKITESWWKTLYSERKAKLNNAKFSQKNRWSQRKVMSFFRITSTNAFKSTASSKKWTLKTHSCCSKPMFKLRKLQQKMERSLKRNRLICSFLEWILKFFEINGITAREIYIYLWRLYLL